MTPTREPCIVCGRPIQRTTWGMCTPCWDSLDRMKKRDGSYFLSSYAIATWAVQRSKRWAKRRGEK